MKTLEKEARHVAVERRAETFTDRPATRIWYEQPDDSNPYIARQCLCHGYDLLELAAKRSFIDVLYLIFRGELPGRQQSQLLEQLMICFINPGPRHPATRAAMNAAVSKTDSGHLLPISLSILSAAGVEECVRFLRKNSRGSAETLAEDCINAQNTEAVAEGDRTVAPGFGSYYGSIDTMAQNMADHLRKLTGNNKNLHWGNRFAYALRDHNMGWLATGVVAAVLADLGFQPRAAAGLYQYLCAPGLLAHGVEMANKPVTAMPFVSDENYVIEK